VLGSCAVRGFDESHEITYGDEPSGLPIVDDNVEPLFNLQQELDNIKRRKREFIESSSERHTAFIRNELL
jgi:hypothetical protein